MAEPGAAPYMMTCRSLPRRTRWRAALALSLGLTIMGCQRPADTTVDTTADAGAPPASGAIATPPPAALGPQDIAEWHGRLAEQPDTAACDAALSRLAQAARSDANRPVLAYLGGEICLKAGQPVQALQAFQSAAAVVAEAGGAGMQPAAGQASGLAAVALWRWLQLLGNLERPSDEQAEQVLAHAARLQPTLAFEGMVRSGLLPALPLLEEDIARRLAAIARRAGRPEANDLLLAFISVDSSGDLLPAEQVQIQKMVADGVISQPRLDLFRYRRQLSLVQTEKGLNRAAGQLLKLWNDRKAPDMVRAEAAYEWGNYRRRSGLAAIPALSAAFTLAKGAGPIAERALYGRAMAYNTGNNRRTDLFFRDMRQLLADFPDSRLLDDALYQIGSEQLLGIDAKPQEAFKTFEALRARADGNDWFDSAFFVPALGHIVRGQPGDLDAADQLLKDYLARTPQGIFRHRCLFWRGRIAAMRQDEAAARDLYLQVEKEVPFDYYGMRARLHLDQGEAAVVRSLPPRDSAGFAELRARHRAAAVPVDVPAGQSPMFQRVLAAKHSGLYERLREEVDGLGRVLRTRIDKVALADLDKKGLLPSVALLLAWRQDALRVRGDAPSAATTLRLSTLLGHGLGDWPVAMLLLSVPVHSPRAQLSELQQDPHYLAVAYPGLPELEFLREPLDAAAWPVAGSKALAQALMYAVIRQESAFFPGAISSAGALGPFQIRPPTFKDVAAKCRQGADPNRPEAFLFDALRSATFWSCWVQHEFRPESRDDLALMLVKHQAGAGNLSNWRDSWKDGPIEKDVELQIETMRFPATRNFVRKVLADITIVEAAGLFDSADAEGGRK